MDLKSGPSGLDDNENEEIEYQVPEQVEEQVQQFEEERFPFQDEIDFAGETSVDSSNNELPCSSNADDGSSTADGNQPLPLQRNMRNRKIDSDDKPSSTNDANDGPSTAAEKVPMQRRGNVKEKKNMKEQKKNTKTPVEPAERVYRWRKTEPPAIDASFKGDEFKDSPDEAENITPLTYFCVFFH